MEYILHGTQFILRIAFILLVGKVFCEIFSKYLKQPPVLGELFGGILIGPYVFGKYIPGVEGKLFAPEQNLIPLSPDIWAIAQFGIIILLFLIGLNTDLRQIRRYGKFSIIIALGGVITPFLCVAGLTMLLGYSKSFFSPVGLFMGAALTATSVSITARILMDIDKLESPEGVTILTAAVIDDILGILMLAIATGIVKTGHIEPKKILLAGLKSISFFVAIAFILALISKGLTKFIELFKTKGTTIAIVVALCFFISVLVESIGLAMIIGAFAFGVALSTSRLKRKLLPLIEPVSDLTSPIFFTMMGMLFDPHAFFRRAGIVIAFSLVGFLGKTVGCTITALIRFRGKSALRVGIGMSPFGEVALIIAGIGLITGVLNRELFSAIIVTPFITTLLTSIILPILFRKHHTR